MSPQELDIGPVEVTTNRDDVSSFLNALYPVTNSPGAADFVPLTFPIRWLSLPEVRDAIMTTRPDPETVFLHAGQSFDYEKSLLIDCSYHLHVHAAGGAGNNDRLNVAGTVVDESGELVLTMEATLLLLQKPTVESAGQ